MPAGDFTKQIQLIISAKGQVGRDFKTLREDLIKFKNEIKTVESTLKKLSTSLKTINAIRFRQINLGIQNFAKAVLSTNKALEVQLKLLRQLKTARGTARAGVEADPATTAAVTRASKKRIAVRKQETDEINNILATLGKEELELFQQRLQRTHGHYKTFGDRVRLVTRIIKQNFGAAFKGDVFVQQRVGMDKFTGSLDVLNRKISVGKGKNRDYLQTAEELNTIIHEHVELILRETGAYDGYISALNLTEQETVDLIHQESLAITKKIVLNEWLHKNTVASKEYAASLRTLGTAQAQLAGVGVGAGAGFGGQTIDKQTALWGKLSAAIQKAQAEARIFGSAVGEQIGVTAALHSEITALAAKAGVAFRPGITEEYNKTLRRSILILQVARERMEEFAASSALLEKSINAFEKLYIAAKKNTVATKEQKAELEALRATIDTTFGIAFPTGQLEPIKKEFASITNEVERFRRTFEALGATTATGRMKVLTEDLAKSVRTLTNELLELVTGQNAAVNAQERAIGVTGLQIEESTAFIGVKIRQSEIIQKEIAQQQELILQYRALVLTYQELKTQQQDVTGVTRALNSVVDRRNKLVEEGVATTEHFMAAETRNVALLNLEAQSHTLNDAAIDREVAARRQAVDTIVAQAKAQAALIQQLGARPTRFEYEEQIARLNNLLRQTEREISKVNIAKRSLGKADPRMRVLEGDLNRLRVIAGSTDKAILALNNRLRRDLPNSADAARAASRLTVSGFIAMIKSQAAWMAGFALIFGILFNFKQALASQVVIMNETARVMRTMRSEVLTLGETQAEVTQTIKEALRGWGEETQNISQALYELGSAGLTAEESLSALPPIMDLIVGGESEVAQTTRTVAGVYINLTGAVVDVEGALIHLGNTMGKIGKGFEANASSGSKFARIADVMTAAVRDHLIEIDELNQGLKFMLAVGRQANLSFEEMTAILAVLGDNMIRSGMAGRSMRRILSAITKDADKFTEAFGIAIDPEKPVDFIGILKELNEQMSSGTRTAEELGLVFEAMGLRGAPALIILAEKFGAVEAAITRLEDAAGGAARTMAEVQLEKPARQAAILRENILALIREAFAPLINVTVDLLRAVNRTIEFIIKLDEVMSGMLGTIVTFVGTMGALTGAFLLFRRIAKIEFFTNLGAATATAAKATQGMGFSLNLIPPAAAKATAGMALFTRATNAAKTAMAGLIAFARANIFILVITGAVAAAVALNKLTRALAFSLTKYRENIVAINQTITTTTQHINTMIDYERVITTAADAEEAITKLREKGLDQIPGLIALYNTQGDAVLETAANVRKLIEEEQELIRIKLGEELKKLTENYVKLEKQLAKNVSSFKSLDEIVRVMDRGGEATEATIKAFQDLAITTELIPGIMDQLATGLSTIGTTQEEMVARLKKEWNTYGKDVKASLVEVYNNIVKNRQAVRESLDTAIRLRLEALKAGKKDLEQYDETIANLKEQLRIINTLRAVRDKLVEKEFEITTFEDIARLRDLRREMDRLRKTQEEVPDLMIADQVSTELFRAEEGWRKYVERIRKMAETTRESHERMMKEIARNLNITTEEMSAIWNAMNEEQLEEFIKLSKNLLARSEVLFREFIRRGQGPVDAMKNAVNRAISELLRIPQKAIFVMKQALIGLDIARELAGEETLARIIAGDPDIAISAWQDFFTHFHESFIAIGEASDDIIKQWEDFNMEAPTREFQKFARRAESFLEGFDITFDLAKQEDQLKAIEALTEQFNAITAQKVKIANLIVSNTLKIRAQERQTNRLRLSIIGINSELAATRIDKIYRDAASGARNLAAEIEKEIDQRKELAGTYYLIRSLENQIFKTTAKNFADLHTQHEGFINARIKLEIQLFNVQKLLAAARKATTIDAQRIKELKEDESTVQEKLLAIQNAQWKNEKEMEEAYKRESEILDDQLKTQLAQLNFVKEMAGIAIETARDESKAISDRVNAAKEAQKFAQQAATIATQVAKTDVEREDLANKMGRSYRNHRDQLKGAAKDSQAIIKESMELQLDLVEEHRAAQEEQNKKLRAHHLEIEKIMGRIEAKHRAVNESVGSTLTGYEMMLKSMEDLRKAAEAFTKELAKDIKKKVEVEVRISVAGRPTRTAKELGEEVLDEALGGILEGGGGGYSGMLVPVRVTSGEGLFMPENVRKNYSRFAQINAGISRPLPKDTRMAGIFQGGAGIDTISTAVPAGSFIMSNRGMKVIHQWDRDIKQASEGGFVGAYQGGGIIESQAQAGGVAEPPDIGIININITDPSGEITTIPVRGTDEDLRRLERAISRQHLTRVQ